MGRLADAAASRVLPDRLGKIADLLERNGIDLDEIGRVERVNLWQGFHKDDEGNAQVVDLAGISLSPKWADGPEWPPVQQAPPVKVGAPAVKARTVDGWHSAVILPDIQAGFFRNADDVLEPIHDEAAIAVALGICRDVRPDLVVLVGDNADFAEFGRYRLTPAFARTTQATVDRLAVLCAEVRAAVGPDCRIVWLAGNHEERLPNHILDNAVAAFGLRRGGAPESWPVLSVPFLCRFDDHGIEYLPGYPASSVWINERLRVIHGDKVRSGGSTAHAYLATEKTSVIFGHVHRAEYAERTREDHDGPKTILAASPGCLARTDGVVPSTKGGTDLDGRPVQRHEDWQQGIAVVDYEPGDGRFVYDHAPIRNGWARWRGKDYTA